MSYSTANELWKMFELLTQDQQRRFASLFQGWQRSQDNQSVRRTRHSAFLNSYASEDEGLYDDFASE
jgi:hypothetical protein